MFRTPQALGLAAICTFVNPATAPCGVGKFDPLVRGQVLVKRGPQKGELYFSAIHNQAGIMKRCFSQENKEVDQASGTGVEFRGLTVCDESVADDSHKFCVVAAAHKEDCMQSKCSERCSWRRNGFWYRMVNGKEMEFAHLPCNNVLGNEDKCPNAAVTADAVLTSKGRVRAPVPLEYRSDLGKSGRREWPDGVVNYVWGADEKSMPPDDQDLGKFTPMAQGTRTAVRHAMNVIESETCICFKEVDPLVEDPKNPKYVNKFQPRVNLVQMKDVQQNDWCWGYASIGAVSPEDQWWQGTGGVLALDKDCNVDTIPAGSNTADFRKSQAYAMVMHEFGHTLGFFHEQSRPDRDQFIQLDKTLRDENTLYMEQEYNWLQTEIPGKGHQFDFSSLMLYGTWKREMVVANTDATKNGVPIDFTNPSAGKLMPGQTWGSKCGFGSTDISGTSTCGFSNGDHWQINTKYGQESGWKVKTFDQYKANNFKVNQDWRNSALRYSMPAAQKECTPCELRTSNHITRPVVVQGNCIVDGPCVMSPGYPKAYPSGQICDIAGMTGTLSVHEFQTEKYYDRLWINAGKSSMAATDGWQWFSDKSLKDGIKSLDGFLYWRPDAIVERAPGWKICLKAPPQTQSCKKEQQQCGDGNGPWTDLASKQCCGGCGCEPGMTGTRWTCQPFKTGATCAAFFDIPTAATVAAAVKPSIAGDPFVTDQHGNRVQFYLSLGRMHHLLTCDDVQLFGKAFGTGIDKDHQQWFDEFRITNGNDVELLHVSIADNITAVHSESPTPSHNLSLRSLKVDVEGVPMTQTGAQVLDSGGLVAIWQGAAVDTVQFSNGQTTVFQIASAVAQKYTEEDKAKLYRHLDLRFEELNLKSCGSGILAEIWGAAPMSKKTAAMLEVPK